MARAKRTDRAEARRRYRAEMGTEVPGDGADEATGSAAAPASRGRTGAPPMSSPPGRIGITVALRQSIHPVNLREDLAALPFLLTRTPAFLIPAALILATTVAVAVVGRSSFVTNLLATYLLEAPSIAAVFIAGFLAPRASWLLGLIVGLLAAICYSALLIAVPLKLYPPELFGPMPAGTEQRFIQSAFLLGPTMGALFAAAAAWYRRFLQLSNPNRGRRATANKKQGPDGRKRSSGSSKPTSARR